MARAGAFDDLDMALTWHPGSINTVSASSTLAVNNIKYRFRAAPPMPPPIPETGRSALDAVELMNVGVNFLREHMPDKARIHYVITNGGGAPNVVPDDAEVWYFIRSPERHQVDELTERVRNIAQGAALMTETTVEERFLSGTYNMLPNQVIGDELMRRWKRLVRSSSPTRSTPSPARLQHAFPDDLRASLIERLHLAETPDRRRA